MSQAKKTGLSAVVVALYVALMFGTQSFAFGAVQLRVATALYALAAPFPFLVLPLGLANGLSNLLMSTPLDALCGCGIGLATAGLCACIRKWHLPNTWVILPIWLLVGLGVALWLQHMLRVPYQTLAWNLLLGQLPCGLLGVGVAEGADRLAPKFGFDIARRRGNKLPK